jgi:hypothetical protein
MATQMATFNNKQVHLPKNASLSAVLSSIACTTPEEDQTQPNLAIALSEHPMAAAVWFPFPVIHLLSTVPSSSPHTLAYVSLRVCPSQL